MYEEAHLTNEARDSFVRYHHASACLYFGIGALEAFLNKQIRQRFKKAKSEEELLKMIKKTSLMKKVSQWPSICCSSDISISSTLIEAIEDYYELRGEVTHQKRRDHSIFKELDAVQPFEFLDALATYLVNIYEQLEQPFPYWLLGWNYVGMNNNPRAVCLSTNQQFMHSLYYLGEKVPAYQYEEANKWERSNMTTLEGFKDLKILLDRKNVDIEPVDPRLPTRPRLCKNWWARSDRKAE